MNPFGTAGKPAYNVQQVLVTPDKAAIRSDIAAFLCPTGFAPMGDAPIRKDGGPTLSGLLTSPASALVSAARSLGQRSTPL